MVATPHYFLSSKTRVNWTSTQEKSLANDFPFDLEKESDDQFVVRTYLQFLWLPESIMPLKLLVPSLLRVPSAPSEPHALHTYLKPLLQTARSASQKYNLELPKILSNGGGAGEIEETMMWYALSYEKADEDLWTRAAAIGEGPWEDEKWRSKWLERMERREYKIQILLYFLELSLPGPPLPPPSPQKGKGKGKRSREETNTGRPPEECLEIFMDKLSMWQLMEGLENVTKPPETSFNENPLDWIQIFFEEVVKPQFETQLPELCSLMRSKIFPHSLFSSSSPGSSSPSSSRATSPDISSRQPSPAPSNTSSKARPLVRDRERSRSLSVSLAQERERERERSVTTLLPKKRALNREVSMSRAFKPKPKARASQEKEENVRKAKVGLQNEGARAKNVNEPTTKDEGVLLVEATPTRPKLARSQSTFSVNVRENETAEGTPSRSHSRTQSFSFQASLGTKDDTDDDIDDEGDEDEDEWRLPGSSSPGVLLLKRGRHVGDAQAAGVLVDCTPTKRSRLR
ncbi:hypothetical protein D9615_009288 [Tricholomella constricta]|uniref:DNA replication regulator Sld3 C-terminal domain-containing protein n=1 Tax=Tricholomella constricta TaxID=117010 RepID=A0A8H5GWA2_9AGAR|nr:hypothetical protein D9615_009288 [Tricholomella constricta]